MKQRTIDEMIAYFNQQVSEMDIDRKYKIQLLGMITAIGFEAQKRKWIPCTERLPEDGNKSYWVCTNTGYQYQCRWTDDVFGLGVSDKWRWKIFDIPQYSKVVAWMPLPEPYREDGGGA